MNAGGLLFRHEYSSSTILSTISQGIREALEQGPFQYRFEVPSQPGRSLCRSSHHVEPLTLMALVSRGQARARDDAVRLTAISAEPTMTLGQILSDRNRFIGVTGRCIENERLVIHFCKP